MTKFKRTFTRIPKEEPEESFWDQPAFVIPTKRWMYFCLGVFLLVNIIVIICKANHVGETAYTYYYTQAEQRQGYPESETRWR